MSYSSQNINTKPPLINAKQKLFSAIGAIGFFAIALALFNTFKYKSIYLSISILLITVGIIGYSIAEYSNKKAGIKNNGVWFSSISSRGLLAWISGILLTLFYIALYWYPEYLGLGNGEQANSGLVALFDPFSMFLKNEKASQWFVYGTFYTLAILLFGIKFILKYRHNRYQIIRTVSVIFFQTAFAFIIPEIMLRLNQPYMDLKNVWPLNYYFFFDWNLSGMISSGSFGLFMLVWCIALIFIVTPILTYFYGKRWYCSWVCGCGGLAETAGDPFRHLSDKSLNAWKFERYIVHGVLLFVTVMTLGVLYNFFSNSQGNYILSKPFYLIISMIIIVIPNIWIILDRNRFKELDKIARYGIHISSALIIVFLLNGLISAPQDLFFIDGFKMRKWYGFLIGAAFSGVIGVGFYPIMGSRVWCRFGCPMAAILGIQQRFFSRFRITTNGGQCISCGNCSTYCEMGIDVKSYAQKGQNIVRASCVGCGICSAVCPRGVLKLENDKNDGPSRTEHKPISLGNDGISIEL